MTVLRFVTGAGNSVQLEAAGAAAATVADLIGFDTFAVFTRLTCLPFLAKVTWRTWR